MFFFQQTTTAVTDSMLRRVAICLIGVVLYRTFTFQIDWPNIWRELFMKSISCDAFLQEYVDPRHKSKISLLEKVHNDENYYLPYHPIIKENENKSNYARSFFHSIEGISIQQNRYSCWRCHHDKQVLIYAENRDFQQISHYEMGNAVDYSLKYSSIWNGFISFSYYFYIVSACCR